jgi:hypothetical protein
MTTEAVPCAHLNTIRTVHSNSKGEHWSWYYVDEIGWE